MRVVPAFRPYVRFACSRCYQRPLCYARSFQPSRSKALARRNLINLEESGAVANRTIFADWHSAQWQMEPVKGSSGFVRLRNIWKPDIYPNAKRSRLEAGKVRSDWLSAMWNVEPIQGTQFVRLGHRLATGLYLHTKAVQSNSAPFNWIG